MASREALGVTGSGMTAGIVVLLLWAELIIAVIVIY